MSINSSAVDRPALITELADQFGSQCVVVAIDTKFTNDEWMVYIHGGRTATPRRAVDWAKEVERLGAGEILLTSMDRDGTKSGFALDITREVSEAINIPVIASGGAEPLALRRAIPSNKGKCRLRTSVFHFGEIPIPTLKEYLNEQNIPVR